MEQAFTGGQRQISRIPGRRGSRSGSGGGRGGPARGLLIEQQFELQRAGQQRSETGAATSIELGVIDRRGHLRAHRPTSTRTRRCRASVTTGPGYGGKIPSIANLAGKKIMIIPGVSALAACDGDRAGGLGYRQGGGHGADDLRQPGHDGRAQHRDRERDPPGIRGDRSWGARWTRRRARPRSPRPEKAGLVVGAYGGTPDMDQRGRDTYNTVDPYALDAKLAAEQAIAQHNGQPFNAIAITSNATGPATRDRGGPDQADAREGLPEVHADRGERRGAELADAGRQLGDLRSCSSIPT